MNRQTAKCALLTLTLMTPPLALPSVPISYKSPEFTIHEPSGKTALLSSLQGKVVVLEFLFINSQHCLRVAKTLNKLHAELGPGGFLPVGVVFDPPNAANTGAQYLAMMVDYLKLSYPVGYSVKADVDKYLGRSGSEILNIPQIVVIDRSGVIREASGGAGGDSRLEDENSLRALINNLLKEGGPPGPKKKQPTRKTKELK
jgi:peroxiredoxin